MVQNIEALARGPWKLEKPIRNWRVYPTTRGQYPKRERWQERRRGVEIRLSLLLAIFFLPSRKGAFCSEYAYQLCVTLTCEYIVLVCISFSTSPSLSSPFPFTVLLVVFPRGVSSSLYPPVYQTTHRVYQNQVDRLDSPS